MSEYPRETVEFIPVTVTVDGEEVTSGVAFSVVQLITGAERPGAWIAPVALGGRIGVMTDQQEPGIYAVWAKITDAPEIPVVFCGEYKVT